MTRAEALAAIKAGYGELAPGQATTVRLFRPEDGPGVARLFYQIYGEGYPVDTPYVPEQLIEANRTGVIRTIVAVGGGGDVIGQAALYQGSPPNKRLYEYGQMLVDKAYRGSMAAGRMYQFALREMFGKMDGVDGLLGEAVCHHVMTQKLSRAANTLECGLELALLPWELYADEGATGRVSCLLHVRVDAGGTGPLVLPEPWRVQLEAIFPQWALAREIRAAGPGDAAPAGSRTVMEAQHFGFAGVTRLNVFSPGEDFAARLSGELDSALAAGHTLLQVYLCLGGPGTGQAAETLGRAGFFFGGFAPLWFGAAAPGPDALLVQRLLEPARLSGLSIQTSMGESIRDMVLKDMARAGRESGSPQPVFEPLPPGGGA